MAEFSKKQMALIDANRDYNTGEGWWSSDSIEAFCEEMSLFGISVDKDKVQWSGFWSQGDGASFAATPRSLLRYIEHYEYLLDKQVVSLPSPDAMTYRALEPYYTIYHTVGAVMMELRPQELIDALQDVEVRVSTAGRYCHSGNMMVELEPAWNSDAADILDTLTNGEVKGLESALRDDFRAIADELYRRLEEEYDYLTSDEAVWEGMEANNFAGVNRVAA
jgi:hypothetical protein